MSRVFWIFLAPSAAAIAIALAIWQFQNPREGVRSIVWGEQSCEECHMSIDDPSFAAQLQAEDGQVFDFDDPGCLFNYLLRKSPSVHAIYFHAMNGRQWLRENETAFIATKRSPMGYDLGAVPVGTSPKARSFERILRQWNDDDAGHAAWGER